MTDKEIIKALECCGVNHNCAGCPKEKEPYGCYFVLCGGALDLINRQNAEIERLNIESETLATQLKGAYEQIHKLNMAKSEAIKEFAERICNGRVSNDPVVIAVRTELECIKEMTEQIENE